MKCNYNAVNVFELTYLLDGFDTQPPGIAVVYRTSVATEILASIHCRQNLMSRMGLPL